MNSIYKHTGVAASLLLALAALSAPQYITAQSSAATKGDKSFGVRAGYNTRNESPVAGLYFQYSFTDWLRLGANMDYVFRHHGTDAFALNVNAHFTVINVGRFTIYPLAGLSYTSWQVKTYHENSSDTSSRSDYLGLNIGGGADYHITSTLKLNLEAKYDAMKHHSTGIFTLGVAYCF